MKEPILLVEDDPDIQENLCLFLELEGYRVQSAFNGQQALDYLRAAQPASLILLDLMMPVMDGYEFLDAFFAHQPKAFGGFPLIVISAVPEVARIARERGLSFIKKPIDLEKLLTEIGSRCARP